MAKAPATTADKAAELVKTPREQLRDVLVDRRMSGKRFAEDEQFLKQITRSAFEGEFDKKLKDVTDEQVVLVLKVITL
jgi:hypothetical protein